METCDITRKLLSIKFILSVLVLAISTVLVVCGVMPIVLWVDLSKWNLGIYAVGNVGAKAVHYKQEKLKPS